MSANNRSVLAANSKEGSVAPAWTILASTEGLYPRASSLRLVLWGEKVPAAGRAVGDGFGEGDRGPAGHDLARPTPDRAGPLAGGAGQLGGELSGLLLGEVFEGAGGQPGGGRGGDLLHLVEVRIERWSVVAVGVAGDDFAPLLGEVRDGRELLGRQFACGHRPSCLALGVNSGSGFPPPLVPQPRPACKTCPAPPHRGSTYRPWRQLQEVNKLDVLGSPRVANRTAQRGQPGVGNSSTTTRTDRPGIGG